MTVAPVRRGGGPRTQHLITGVLPEIGGDTATVVASLMAVHRRASATGGSLWTVGGTYRFGLRRAVGRWVIDGLSLRVAWQPETRA